MKLAIVTDSLSRSAGGLFQAILRLAQELQRAGIEVRVFGVADARTEEDLPQWQPLRPVVLPRRGPGFFGYAPGLVEAIRAERPAAIEIHGLWKYTSIALLRSSAALRCPYIVHPHGMLDPWAVRNSRWKKRLAAWAYERRHLEGAACIRALCRSEASAIRRYGLRNPICIVPNASDPPIQTPDDRNAKPPFPPGRKVLLYLGRIHPKKGLMNLLEAWACVQKSTVAGHRPDQWVLALAGWDQGGHESRLRCRASELGLRDTVLFLGPQFDEKKAACYRHCDAFVLPSLSEGLPMVILEAWAYGKPVLMTPECNLPEGFAVGAAVRMETTPESICSGLRTLVEMNDAQRHAMGQRGLALVKARYTWREVGRQMREVYEWVLGGGAAPACVEFA